MNSCAKIVKKIRKELYLQQDELAELLGISTASICKYERGGTMPRLRIARKIKSFADKNGMNIKMEDLVGE